MAINIKNDETASLLRELARLTGESQTEAVTEAIKERLARVRAEQRPSLTQRLLSIGADCAARLREPFRSTNHGELLYGPDGLPR